jgi:hypothetical protein
MQQRRLRLGDILDDYCPRERRITNHAVVAMIDDEVKQTRCTTCDADHEYRQARLPPPRRKKDTLAPPNPTAMPDYEQQDTHDDETPFAEDVPVDATAIDEQPAPLEAADAEEAAPGERDDDGPVHRRLIRAQLPRQEGQQPERKIPDFTARQPGGPGNQRHGRGRRNARGPQGSFSGPMRFGSQNASQGGRQQRQNGNGNSRPQGNQRGSGRPQGQQRGPGRKRGR